VWVVYLNCHLITIPIQNTIMGSLSLREESTKHFTLKITASMKEQFIKYIAFGIGLIIAFIVGKNSCNSNRLQIVTNSDTVVVLKARIDTIQKERIKLRTIYEKQVDTIYLYDSIAIDSAYTKAIEKLREYERAGFYQ